MIEFDLFKEWIPSINEKSSYVYDGSAPDDEVKYPAFMLNRYYSMSLDTVLVANELNQYPDLDPKMQYDFLYHAVPKKKRFNKWAKGTKDTEIQMISDAYNISLKRAEEVSDLFSEEDIKSLQEFLDKGGRK